MELKIRPAESSEKIMLAEITEPSYQAVLADFGIDKLHIAFSDAAPVGWLYLRMPDNPREEGFLFVYVIPEQRKKGIGAEIFRYAEARMTGCAGGWWTSYPEFAEADRIIPIPSPTWYIAAAVLICRRREYGCIGKKRISPQGLKSGAGNMPLCIYGWACPGRYPVNNPKQSCWS